MLETVHIMFYTFVMSRYDTVKLSKNDSTMRPGSVILDTDKIEAVLLREGRTKAWLADRCCLSVGHLRQAIGGHRPISAGAFRLLLDALNATAEDVTFPVRGKRKATKAS